MNRLIKSFIAGLIFFLVVSSAIFLMLLIASLVIGVNFDISLPYISKKSITAGAIVGFFSMIIYYQSSGLRKK